MKLLRKFKT